MKYRKCTRGKQTQASKFRNLRYGAINTEGKWMKDEGRGSTMEREMGLNTAQCSVYLHKSHGISTLSSVSHLMCPGY